MCYVTGDTVMLPVHISCDPPVGDVEERMAETITAAAKAANLAPNVDILIQQYHQTSVKSEKDRYRHLIKKRYLNAIEGVVPRDRAHMAEMMTRMALADISVDRAEMSS